MKINTILYYVGMAVLLAASPSEAQMAAKDREIQAPVAAEEPEQPEAEAGNNDMPPVIGSNVAGNYLSSQFARSSGNIDEAVRYLVRVHHDQPDNNDIAIRLEGLLLLQGQVDQAVTIAEQIRKNDGNDPLATLLLVLSDMKKDQSEAAAKTLSQLAGPNSAQLWAPLISAWIDIARKTMTNPLTIADLGTQMTQTAPLMHYHMALINEQAGFTAEAAENFKAAVSANRDPAIRVMKMLLRFYDQHDQPETLKKLVEEYQQKHPEDTYYNDVLAIKTPQDGISEILYTMGGVMFAAGVSSDAAIYMQLAVYINPDFPEAAMTLGDIYSDLRQYARANTIYGKVSKESASYDKAQQRIAINLERMGNIKASVALLDTLARNHPDAPDALVTKGDLMRIHNRFDDAVKAYSLAIKRVPELKSLHWPILFARGACYERLGQWKLAEADLQHALELKPEQPDVLNYLAYGWLERGQNVTQAREMIQKAVQARPNDGQIVDSMGWSLYMQGQYDRAMGYMEKAVELMPGDATINDHLGDVYWRNNRKTEARFQWERALSFSPERNLAASIGKKIKNGLPPASKNTSDVSAIEKPTAIATP